MDFLAGLNPQQQAAVAHINGPLLILAGAGSGKTRVVTHRISHLIANHAVKPESILAVTFTNKAAGEMRKRVEGLLGGVPGRGPNLFTFHSFCVRLLRRDGLPLADWRPGFTRSFLIYDDDDQLSILKSLYKEHNIDDKLLPPRNVLSAISHAKNKGTTEEELASNARDQRSKWVASLYQQYNHALVRANALDFDDLLLETVRLLRQHAPTREAWSRRLQHLMIDEYQDTNRPQYELVRLLSHSHSNVCAVGDEDQSIYSWRGADIRNILDFEGDYPNAVVIRLEQNYRSTKTILEASSAMISKNIARKGKWLWTESGQGSKIIVYQGYDGEQEALWIADQIDRLLRKKEVERAAVLYRTNAQSRQVEEALRRYRLSYHVVGGLSFYQRAEIKDILAYLRLMLAPTDAVSLLRIINTPARGIGKTTVEQMEVHARNTALTLWDAMEDMLEGNLLPLRAATAVKAFHSMIEELRASAATAAVHQLIRELLERTGYKKMLEEDRSPGAESRLENLNELLNAAAEASERGEALADFLDHAALISDADQVDLDAKVSLLTVHNAKGLEFPAVFLAGMEEGLFPHSRSVDSEAMLEEERRLCYVGMTRAEKRLFLTHSQARRRYGGGPLEPASPSRFLLEIPEELCEPKGTHGMQAAGFEAPGEIDLFAERSYVRESARQTASQIRQSREQRQSYPGKTYNSVENIAEFFRERGISPKGTSEKPTPVVSIPKSAAKPVFGASIKKKKVEGATVNHAKYGRGTVVRKEGDGDDAKLSVLFPGHGIVKLVAKYAGIKIEE